VTHESKNFTRDDPRGLRVFVHCAKVQTAAFIFAKMNGRFFDGNKVEAYFFEEERFAKGLFDSM